MSTQTYVKRGKGYTAKLTTLGGDADFVDGDYQVYVDVAHEWGSALSPSTRLMGVTQAGDSVVQVNTTNDLSVGDFIIFSSGAPEHRIIDNIEDTTLTLDSPLVYNHANNSVLIKMSLATRVSEASYEFAISPMQLTSSGKYHIRWVYVTDGETCTEDQFVDVYQPYITASDFFGMYPEYEASWDDKFDNTERIIRNIINTYCGQRFEYYSNKTQVLEGNDSTKLDCGMRLENVWQVVQYPSADITNSVSIDRRVQDYLVIHTSEELVKNSSVNIVMPTDYIGKFSSKLEYEITADWGWSNIPSNISQAAALLLNEYMSDDSSFRRHHIRSITMDSEAVSFDSKNVSGSTGNLDADVLLLDYTKFIVGVI